MIEERATVLSSAAGQAEVISVRRSTCSGCSASASCGTSLLDRLFGRRPVTFVVADPLGTQPGETVIIGIPEQGLLAAAFAAYMVPLGGLISGGILGDALGDVWSIGEWTAIPGAALGLWWAFHWLVGFNRRQTQDPRLRPVVLRRTTAVSPTVVGITLPPSPAAGRTVDSLPHQGAPSGAGDR